MRHQSRFALTLALCLTLAGCSGDLEKWSARMTTASERQFAHEYLGLAAVGLVDSMTVFLAPELTTAANRLEAARVVEAFRLHPPDSLILIGVNVHTSSGARDVNFSWEYRSESAWFAVNVAARHQDGARPVVFGFNVVPLEGSLREANAFTVRDKSATHFAFLLLALGAVALSLVSAVRLALAREMPRRWRWVAISFIGVTKISINWTSGATAFQLLSVTLLSAGTVKAAAAAPMFIYFSFPIGAILALQHLSSWHRTRTRPDDIGPG